MISRRGLRAPVPRGCFLRRQKVTKKLLKGSPLENPESAVYLRSGQTGLILLAVPALRLPLSVPAHEFYRWPLLWHIGARLASLGAPPNDRSGGAVIRRYPADSAPLTGRQAELASAPD